MPTKRTTAPKKKAGRPTKATQTVAHLDGQPIDATDRIIASLKAGDYLETAAAAAGIKKPTLYDWLRRGANATAATARAEALGKPAPKLSDLEKRCIQFSDAVAAATAEWHQRSLVTLEGLARGGHQSTTTTVKRNAEGDVIETTTKTETLPPNAQVLMWRLTRRFPDKYAQRIDVGLTGDLGADQDELAGSLASTLAAFQAQSVPVLDVTESEGPTASK